MDDLAAMLGRHGCPACHKPYERSDLEWIGMGRDDVDLYVRCGGCDFQTLLIVHYVTDRSRSAYPVEPSPPPVPPITVDDVLDMYLFLRGFSGDIHDLLGSGVRDRG